MALAAGSCLDGLLGVDCGLLPWLRRVMLLSSIGQVASGAGARGRAELELRLEEMVVLLAAGSGRLVLLGHVLR